MPIRQVEHQVVSSLDVYKRQEEAWKALSSANMAEYLRYMYKTVRKYYGEAIAVSYTHLDVYKRQTLRNGLSNL